MRWGLRGAVLQPRVPGSGLEGWAQTELWAAEGQEGGWSRRRAAVEGGRDAKHLC